MVSVNYILIAFLAMGHSLSLCEDTQFVIDPFGGKKINNKFFSFFSVIKLFSLVPELHANFDALVFNTKDNPNELLLYLIQQGLKEYRKSTDLFINYLTLNRGAAQHLTNAEIFFRIFDVRLRQQKLFNGALLSESIDEFLAPKSRHYELYAIPEYIWVSYEFGTSSGLISEPSSPSSLAIPFEHTKKMYIVKQGEVEINYRAIAVLSSYENPKYSESNTFNDSLYISTGDGGHEVYSLYGFYQIKLPLSKAVYPVGNPYLKKNIFDNIGIYVTDFRDFYILYKRVPDSKNDSNLKQAIINVGLDFAVLEQIVNAG